jgi:hypothetical protein
VSGHPKATLNALGAASLALCTLMSCAKRLPNAPSTQPSDAAKPIPAPPQPPIVLPPVRVARLAGARTLYPPNPKATPGALDRRVTKDTIRTTICVAGYIDSVDLSIAYADPIETRLLASGHLPGAIQNYELDHLVPLNLGGSPTSPRNLWMEPYGDANHLLKETDKWPDDGSVLPGAHQKDVVEMLLNKDVCDGKIALKDAQERIRTDWYAIYKERAGGSDRAK